MGKAQSRPSKSNYVQVPVNATRLEKLIAHEEPLITHLPIVTTELHERYCRYQNSNTVVNNFCRGCRLEDLQVGKLEKPVAGYSRELTCKKCKTCFCAPYSTLNEKKVPASGIFGCFFPLGPLRQTAKCPHCSAEMFVRIYHPEKCRCKMCILNVTEGNKEDLHDDESSSSSSKSHCRHEQYNKWKHRNHKKRDDCSISSCSGD